MSCILLGWGAAIPFGPINLEMMRRNLTFGTRFGIGLGIGACSADLTYVVLLCLGALTMLNHPDILRAVGIVGSLILAWFGYSAIKAKPVTEGQSTKRPSSVVRSWLEGYLLTLINPFTILFWASVSTQLITITKAQSNAVIVAGLGVIIGAFSWVCVYNSVLHFTRHKLNAKVVHWLNIIGGVILLAFAAYGFYRAVV
ncbi:MAG: LysE family translocator [Gammaproteobacteria bacterium]